MGEVLVSAETSLQPPTISGNGGSDFVVVWNDVTGFRLKGKIIRARGATESEEFPVNGESAGEHALPAAAMVGGFAPGFAVVWNAAGEGGRNVLLQRFRPDGGKTGPEISVNTGAADMGYRPAIARLPSLNLVVSWVSADQSKGIRARVFGPDGTPMTDEFQVNTSEGVHFGRVAVAALENNSFVIAWRGGSNEASASRTLRFQVFQPTGEKIGGEQVPNISGFNGEHAMSFISTSDVSTEPGQFVIVYPSGGAGEERIVEASVFGPNGDLRSTFNVTHRADQSIGAQPAVAAMPNQRFMAVWKDRKVPHVGDVTGDNVRALQCSTTQGGLTSSSIQVSAAEAGNQTWPCATTIVDDSGEVSAVAWVDDSVSGAEVNRRAVKVRVFDGSGPTPP